MRVLVVAPHFDDAPLSLGQSLIDGVLAEATVTVGIVFSRSNWTQWVFPTRRRAPFVSAIRRAEEQWAALRFGFSIRTGGLEEVILRTGSMEPSQLLDPTFAPRADPAYESVRDLLASWTADGGADAVMAPLGIGDHVDHQLVAAAAHELAGRSSTPIVFYEDRPYASVADDAEIAAAVAAVDPGLEARDLSGPISAVKTKRLFYPSQFDRYFADAMGNDETQGRRERAWARPEAAWPPSFVSARR